MKQEEWLRILNEEKQYELGLLLSKYENQRAPRSTLPRASAALEQPWLLGEIGVYLSTASLCSGCSRVGWPHFCLKTLHLTASRYPGGSEGNWETPESYTEKQSFTQFLFPFPSPHPNVGEISKRS